MSQNTAQVLVEGLQTQLSLVASQPGYVASTWKRLTALFIDGSILMLFWLPSVSFEHFKEGEIRFSPVLAAVALLMGPIYSSVMLKRFSRTLGKMAMGLTVVDRETGEARLTWNQVLSRTVPQFLTFNAVNAFLAVALLRKDRRHVFDLLADTRVIQANPRESEPSKRWVIGLIGILFCGYSGIASIADFARSFSGNCPKYKWDNGSVVYRIQEDRTCK
ncbi:MAG: RDD family protein [Bdellovibrionia bacterium]